MKKSSPLKEFIDVETAMRFLKYGATNVRNLCKKGLLKAEKIGNSWQIYIDSLRNFERNKINRKPGRPKLHKPKNKV